MSGTGVKPVDYKTAARDIGKGQVLPMYLCYGTETFLMREFIGYLTQKLIEPEYRDFAISRYDLNETSLDVVLEDAGTLPFMAEKKLVIADNALFFTGAKEQAKQNHQPEKLLEYCKQPSPTTVLLLTVAAEKLDERKKIVKSMKEATIPFLPMNADSLMQWMNRRAEQKGISFAPGAADQLIVYTGGALQAIAAELEKLSLYTGQGGVVTGDIVDKLVSRGTEQNVFIMIDDIVRLRLNRAFEILYELLKQREEPVKLTLLIARQFRIMLQAKELSARGLSQQQIASQLSLHPYAVKIAAEQARQFSVEQLEQIMSRLAELDYRMKSGKIDKVLGLELFLMQLAA